MKTSSFSVLRFLSIVVAGFLFCGCHRAPRTAAELKGALPRQFRGDLTLQADRTPHQIVIEPHEFTVRSEHVLGFERVRYQVLTGGEVLTEGDAGIRGTISAPGLEIRVEEVTDAGDTGSGEVIKAETFKGNFSTDLHTVEAGWQSGLGQWMKLKVTAAAP